MLRLLLLSSVLISTHAYAEPIPGYNPGGMHPMAMTGEAQTLPIQGGQAAFTAIQEIVEILEAGPTTDWSKVDIEGLRQHLIDMDNVTLHAEVKSEVLEGGMRFIVNGAGPFTASIQRMTTAHAMTMSGAGDWQFAAVYTDTGVILTVKTPVKDTEKLR